MIRHPKAGAFALAIAGIVMLTACGKIGTLDRPAPLAGARAKADWAAQQKAASQAAASAKAHKQNEPDRLPPDRIQDPYTMSGPERAHPIPGAPTGPNPPAPPGALPDPMTSPQ